MTVHFKMLCKMGFVPFRCVFLCCCRLRGKASAAVAGKHVPGGVGKRLIIAMPNALLAYANELSSERRN